MSATLSPLAPLPTSSAELVSGATAMLDPASTGAGDANPFSTLLYQAMGKQVTEDINPKLLNLIGELTGRNAAQDGSLDANAEDALAALLPFLEGMGLLPTDATTIPMTLDTTATLPLVTPAVHIEDDLAGNALAAHMSAGADVTAKSAVAALSAGSDSILGTSAGNAAENKTLDMGGAGTGRAVAMASAVASDSGFAAQLKTAMEPVPTQAATPTSASIAASHPATAAVPTAGQSQLQVGQPVGASGWSDEVSNHVVLMTNRKEDRAELVLTPPQMGRVQVSIMVNGDQASASFTSANPVVREALEAALPRLREMLAESGIQLGQAQVGAENPRQMTQQDKNGDNFPAEHSHETGKGLQLGTTDTAPSVVLKPGRGLVDVFA